MMTQTKTVEEQLVEIQTAMRERDEQLRERELQRDLQIATILQKFELIADRLGASSQPRNEEGQAGLSTSANPVPPSPIIRPSSVHENPPVNQEPLLEEPGALSYGTLQEMISNAVEQKVQAEGVRSQAYTRPYSRRIQAIHMPTSYHPPKFQQFSGVGNPKQHVAHFIETCNNAGTDGDLLVKQFGRSLKGNAFDWFIELPAESIDSWEQLESEFLSRFYSTKRTVTLVELTNLKQHQESEAEGLPRTGGRRWLGDPHPEKGEGKAPIDRGDKNAKFRKKEYKTPSKEALATNIAEPQKISATQNKSTSSSDWKPNANRLASAATRQKFTLKDRQAKTYPFPDSDVPGMLEQLLEKNLLQLPEAKRPEDVGKSSDPNYCKYHRLASPHKVRCRQRRLACRSRTIKDARHDEPKIGLSPSKLKEEQPSKPPQIKEAHSISISFKEADMLLGEKSHNRPLFVSGAIKDRWINRILLDSGSAVNILPIRTLKNVGLVANNLQASSLMIQGFNQEGQRALGTIKLELLIGDMTSHVLFHVIDASTSYNVLLGRPWLHNNKVVPSTLHQCFKYYQDGEEKTVFADECPFTEAEASFADAKYYSEEGATSSKAAPPKAVKGELAKPKKQTEEPILRYVPQSRKKGESPFATYNREELAEKLKALKGAATNPPELPKTRTQGFDPNAYRMMAKAGSGLSFEQLQEKSMVAVQNLSPTRKSLQAQDYSIPPNRHGLSYQKHKPVVISGKASVNQITIKRKATTSEETRTSAFDRIGVPEPRVSAFARLGQEENKSPNVPPEPSNERKSKVTNVWRRKGQTEDPKPNTTAPQATEKLSVFQRPGKPMEKPKRTVFQSLGAPTRVPATQRLGKVGGTSSKRIKSEQRSHPIGDFTIVKEKGPEEEEEVVAVHHISADEGNDSTPEEDPGEAPAIFEEGGQNHRPVKKVNLPPVLMAPTSGKPLLLYIAAQEKSLGALLAQNDDQGKERPLYYLSRTMVGAELNYSPTEKTCLALIFAIQKLRHFLLAHSTNLISGRSLKFIMSRPMLSGRLAKWALLLSEFEINFIPQKAIKGQGLANFLADHPIPAEWEVSQSLPDEEVFFIEVLPPWRMYFDGAARKNRAGAGVLFISPNEDLMPYSFILSYCCTNNEAEYQAIILGLGMAIEMGLSQLEIFGDSALVIKQIIGDFEVRKDELMPYQKEAQRLLQKISNVTRGHVPRASNSQADALAGIAASLAQFEARPERIPICERWVVPTLEKFSEEEEINLVSVYAIEEEDWRQQFLDYLEHKKIPEEPRLGVKMRRRVAPKFCTFNNTPYRRSYDGILLRCVSKEEGQAILAEAHGGICGAHQGPQTASPSQTIRLLLAYNLWGRDRIGKTLHDMSITRQLHPSASQPFTSNKGLLAIRSLREWTS
ncbi:hypothetical protein H6P81_003070 [Aristolochia fimbriata]|uniref:RNase H type-1 domain-containing protein n=1 Tax=Aristolochia fimbriata TaxID=158543 RepID=A0AAV7FET1_ARIFI|nr:hypothetical protein H6P81_003070 [Aristolochia fimbriata]